MIKQLIAVSILIILFATGVTFLLSHPIDKAQKEIMKAYHAPDTTITIHNGVPDTVIIIRK